VGSAASSDWTEKRVLIAFAVLSIFLGGVAAALQAAQPAEQWLPPDAVIVLHITQPSALLDLAADLKLPEAVAAAQSSQKQPPNSDWQSLLRLGDELSSRLSTDWKGVVRKLTGAGITYAVYPGDRTVVAFDAEDPRAMEQLRQLVQGIVGQQSGAPDAAKRGVFYRELPGGAAWSFDGKQYFALAGDRLVMCNRPDMLKRLFQPRSEGALASSPLYAQALKAAGEATAAWLFVNMAMLKQAPPIRQTLAQAGSVPEALLDAAVKQALGQANWIAIGLRVAGRSLSLRAAADGKLDSRAGAGFGLPPDGGPGLLPNLVVPRQLAAASFWRDLHKFYLAKDALFPEKTSAGILFENFMEIFFTGRDLAEDVFAHFRPEVRLVVASQQYDPAAGTPVEQYPAAALVFQVDHADDFGEVFEEAWQKAIGLANFTRGQQAQRGLIFDKAAHRGVPFTYCYFSARGEKDRGRLPARFNLRPALVRFGPYLILSTTDALAKDVIEALNRKDKRPPAARSNAHTVAEITNGSGIAALLRANQSALLRQSVVGSGAAPEQAEAQLSLNVILLQHLDRVRLSLAATPDGQRGEAELQLK
jgi:hypothetical protein